MGADWADEALAAIRAAGRDRRRDERRRRPAGRGAPEGRRRSRRAHDRGRHARRAPAHRAPCWGRCRTSCCTSPTCRCSSCPRTASRAGPKPAPAQLIRLHLRSITGAEEAALPAADRPCPRHNCPICRPWSKPPPCSWRRPRSTSTRTGATRSSSGRSQATAPLVTASGPRLAVAGGMTITCRLAHGGLPIQVEAVIEEAEYRSQARASLTLRVVDVVAHGYRRRTERLSVSSAASLRALDLRPDRARRGDPGDADGPERRRLRDDASPTTASARAIAWRSRRGSSRAR